MATLLLTIPLLFRSVGCILIYSNKAVSDAFGFDDGMQNDDKEIVFSNIAHIFGSVIPIWTQLMSMVFGFIRSKERKEVDDIKQAQEYGKAKMKDKRVNS